MLTILASWFLCAVLFVGLGVWVRRAISTEGDPFTIADQFWMGWSAALLVLQFWNLLFAVNAIATLGLIALAVAGLHQMRPTPGRRLSAQSVSLGVMASAVAIVFSWQALQPPANGDSGIYHVPAVIWSRAFPAVPGLANLNPWLGLHSAYFLYLALLWRGPVEQVVLHIGPPLLVLALCLQCGRRVMHAAWTGSVGPGDWFSGVMLLAVVDQLLGHDFTSASADLPVTIVGALASVAMARLVDSKLAHARANLSFIGLLVAAGVSIKPSFIGLGIGIILASVLLVPRPHGWLPPLRSAVPGVLLVGLGMAGWLATGLVLTGYPLYPDGALAPFTPTRLDPIIRDRIERFVLVWGRSSGGPPNSLHVHSWHWVGPWLRSTFNDNQHVTLPVFLSVVFIGLLFYGAPPRQLFVLLLGPVLGLSFWFFTAPDVRFAGASFWALLAAASWLRLQSVGSSPMHARLALLGLATMLCGAATAGHLASPELSWLKPAGIPRARLTPFTTASGLELTVPAVGACWAAPLPCTPCPRAALRLRRPGQLSDGFLGTPWTGVAKVEGAIEVPDLR
jgi:hypothetical protein